MLITVFALILLLSYPARKFTQKSKSSMMKSLYRYLRRIHRSVGTLIIPLAFCHCHCALHNTGKHSSLGGIIAVNLILLFLCYCLKNKIGTKWKKIHQFLAVCFMILVIMHCISSIIS